MGIVLNLINMKIVKIFSVAILCVGVFA